MTPQQDVVQNSNIRLSELHEQIVTVLQAVIPLMEAAGRLADMDVALTARIERNRERSERHRRNGRPITILNGDHNGHRADIAMKLTSHGLIAECRKCGKQVTA